MRESSLNTLNVNMEVELKQAKAEVHRLRTEKQSLEQEYNDLNKTKDVTTVEVRLRYYLQDPRNVLRGLMPKILGDVGTSSFFWIMFTTYACLPTNNYFSGRHFFSGADGSRILFDMDIRRNYAQKSSWIRLILMSL